MSLWTRAENVWLRIKEWWNRNWILIRPGPEAWRGGVWGALAAATACVVIAGLCLKTGFGYAFDFVFAIFFAALCIPLAMLGVMLLLTIARNLPRLATGIIVGSWAVVMMLWGPPVLGIPIAIVVGVVEGVLGATIATLVAGSFAQAALRKKILVSLLFVGGVAGNVYFVWLLAQDRKSTRLNSSHGYISYAVFCLIKKTNHTDH